MSPEQPPGYQSQPVVQAGVRHPSDRAGETHWVWVMLESHYLVHVNITKLKTCSKTAQEIFSIPQSEYAQKEGTKAHPIHLLGVDALKFINFNNWFNESPWQREHHSKETLLGILEVSHWLQLDHGTQWAVEELDKLQWPPVCSSETQMEVDLDVAPINSANSDMKPWDTPLTSPQRLALAAKYQIKHWIRPAINQIFDRQENRKQLRLLSSQDIGVMGLGAYEQISKGLESVNANRIAVAINPPDVTHALGCIGQYEDLVCSEVWKKWWFATIPQVMLRGGRGEQPVKLHELADFLKSSKVPSFRAECLELTVVRFSITQMVTSEELIRQKVADNIWDLYKH